MVQTTTLGGTATGVVVAKVIHGLMSMTWVPKPASDEQAFEAIKAGVDALPAGVKMVLNSAQFYGQGWSTMNLELLSRFFEKYPEYADRTFLMVKGGYNPDKPGLDNSAANLRRSVDTCLTALRGKKRIDVFQPARIEKAVSIEDTVKALVELKNEGKFGHIGLSECSAATLRRAHAVYPITVAEIEVSPTSYEEETKKVIAAAAELDIAIAGYSPLGHGLLTGNFASREDIAGRFYTGDVRAHMSRFQEENLRHNLAIVKEIKRLADKKGCTPAQLCIGWVGSLGKKVLPLPGSARKERNLENLAGGDVILTEEEKTEVARVLEANPVKGGRYSDNAAEDNLLWG
ncbi:aldo/keto reductase [Trametes meyenii]|nr:aldo/keto reductase [Trametes meyenii]